MAQNSSSQMLREQAVLNSQSGYLFVLLGMNG